MNAPLFAQLRYNGPADTLWRLTGLELLDISGPVAVGADARGTLPMDKLLEMRLDAGGEYAYRNQGEHHNWSPLAIAKLQHATRGNSYQTFKEFSRIVDQDQARFNLRGLLELQPAGEAIPIDEVEPATEIVKRFCTGAMSFGSFPASSGSWRERMNSRSCSGRTQTIWPTARSSWSASGLVKFAFAFFLPSVP